MKKILLSGLAVLVLIIGASILFPTPQKANACGFFSDCSTDTSTDYTFKKEQAITEKNHRKMLIAKPVPTDLEDSTERANLISRLKLFNNPDKISYIYLINYGKVMAFYTIKGKVSSVNSLLTDPSQLIYGNGEACNYAGSNCYNVESPDLDGTYGQNGPEGSIFFFTTEGAYVEWHGDYMLADQPLKLTTQPELVRAIK